jgi:glycosyltransferase involved in cell wall biosynthesis
LSRAIWNRKREAFDYIDDHQLHFVAQSEWIGEQVQASPLTERFSVSVIPNGLDPELFRPRRTKGLRAALGIPSHHRVLLFVAHTTTNRRKGFDLLREATASLSNDDTTLISIGGNEPELATSQPHIHLGRIESDLLLSVFYSLADLFIIPSRQDNLPNTVLESMACGTPVVGFDVGGIPDMVRPGETGWLAEKRDPHSLRQTIETALSQGGIRRRMEGRCREIVEKEYTLDVQAQSYRSLYENLLEE